MAGLTLHSKEVDAGALARAAAAKDAAGDFGLKATLARDYLKSVSSPQNATRISGLVDACNALIVALVANTEEPSAALAEYQAMKEALSYFGYTE